MAKEAAKTGAGPTALIAIEQYFPKKERIVEDDLAYQILPTGRAFLWLMRTKSLRAWMVRATEKDFPGLWSGMMFIKFNDGTPKIMNGCTLQWFTGRVGRLDLLWLE